MNDSSVPAPAQPWTPDVDVTPGLAASLISEQFPDLGGAPVTQLATGWDNTAFLVGDRWLFRFPRREIAVPGVRREIAVLPRLAPLLPLPIPNPTFIGQPSDRYGWPFFGASMLPGRELADSELPDAGRVEAAESVGGFLRELHDPVLADLPESADLQVDPMRRGSARARADRAREVLARLAHADIWRPEPGPVSSSAMATCTSVTCLSTIAARRPASSTGATSALATRRSTSVLPTWLSPDKREFAADVKRPVLLVEALAGLRRAISA